MIYLSYNHVVHDCLADLGALQAQLFILTKNKHKVLYEAKHEKNNVQAH